MGPCRRLVLTVVPLLLTLTCVAPGAHGDVSPPAPAPAPINPAAQWTPPPEPELEPVPVSACPSRPVPGAATCLSRVDGEVADASAASAARADAIGSAGTAEAPLPTQAFPQAVTKSGYYSPADLASLYRIPAGLTTDATVAIVDVGSDPNTAAQMSYYRSYFGLPPCSRASGCLREVAQDGSSTLPPTDSGWVTEIALDVQAVSAICPTCHILLVDARSARSTDLGAAVQTAVRLGASYVSMSFGAPDGTQNATLNVKYYNAAGVTYVAAAGDSGYAGGTMFPSSAGNVVAAGGTSAQLVSGHWQQSAWAGTNSGCSSVGLLGSITGLVQSLLSGSSCPDGRAVTDLSALADADTGILFYVGGGWYSGGGTSLAAPILTALYALAGNHTDPLAIYQNATAVPTAFVDITSGRNGTCSTALCVAGSGWDGPTGIGTPAGLAGLRPGGASATPLTRATTASALSHSGTYPTTLVYRLADATTGAPVSGALVQVEADTGRGLVAIGTARTGKDGSLRYAVSPHGPTSYEVLYGGDLSHAASISPSVRVATFAPAVRLTRARGGMRIVARAPWGAAASGLPVSLQRRAGARWHTVRHVRTGTAGTARLRIRTSRRTAYRAIYGGGIWTSGRTAVLRVRR